MPLRLYNTLTNKKEEIRPVIPGLFRMYNCGPTVYSRPHIGNYSSYVFADTIRRYLEYKGYEVKQVMNITDVGHLTVSDDTAYDLTRGEDKMEKQAKKEKKDPSEISKFYTKQFIEDEKALNIKLPHFLPKATKHIRQMQEIIQVLLDRGFAYEVSGNIYYDVTKFADYGKLSGNTLDKLKEGAGGRISDKIQREKRNHHDFSLWISDESHIMKWPSPWSDKKGYPGWHIECTAMSLKYLTDAFKGGKFNPKNFETIDIHTGGEDNIFPHHEDEIAQTEGATGKKFVNFWVHRKHLLVDGKKMSKSKGNFYTVPDLSKKGYEPLVFRLSVISSHYRENANLSFKALDQAKRNLEKTREFIYKLDNLPKNDIINIGFDFLEHKTWDFEDCMDDDLNTPGAVKVVYKFIKEVNKVIDKGGKIKGGVKIKVSEIKDLFKKFLEVLGLEVLFKEKKKKLEGVSEVEIEKLIKERDEARKNKDFEKADEIRKELLKKNIKLRDTRKETEWKIVDSSF